MEVRAATADDYEAYLPLFAQLGVPDAPPSRERFAAELAARILVATLDGVIVGYALYEVLTDTGYVRNLVSTSTHRRTGVGTALMTALRDRFLAAGCSQWCLNVKADNAPALALYQRFGMRRAYATWSLRIATSVFLPSPPADLVLTALPAADDTRAETLFRLLPGQLASARTKASREVLQLRRGDDLLGIAVLSSSIPGAFPFRLLDAAHAGALLAHLRSRLPAGAPFHVGIEDDAALHAAVIALGGAVHFELDHMRGPLTPRPDAP